MPVSRQAAQANETVPLRQQPDLMTAAVEPLSVSGHELADDSWGVAIQDCLLSICPPNVSPEYGGCATPYQL